MITTHTVGKSFGLPSPVENLYRQSRAACQPLGEGEGLPLILQGLGFSPKEEEKRTVETSKPSWIT